MMNKIIGREREKSLLKGAFKSSSAELIALFGRRRVGKTYLVRNSFLPRRGMVFFSVTGMKDGRTEQQIKNFVKQIGEAFYRSGVQLVPRKNWFDTLDLLADEIKNSKSEKIVLFFDEFPWMVTKKSELLTAFEYFWNQHASLDGRVKLIICGSSAGWILNKIVNNRGALYNRVTRRISLEPFSLYETKKYLAYRKINLNNRQIAHLYMVLGGIPFYLSQIKPGLSAIQAVAELAFRKHSFLLEEFDNLYATLFDHNEGHAKLARIIAKHRYGIRQEDLVREAFSGSSGGTVTKWLQDLERAGFVKRIKPFGTKKAYYYIMVDEYSLFYFYWLEPIKRTLHEKSMTRGYWERVQQSPSWNSWAGYAFESLCLKHISQIMKTLELPETSIPYTWRYAPKKGTLAQGAQIDLLFDRDDEVITICEIKYTTTPFVIDKAYAVRLANTLKIFKQHTKSSKSFSLCMVSANGIKKSIYSEELISAVCTLDDLCKMGE